LIEHRLTSPPTQYSVGQIRHVVPVNIITTAKQSNQASVFSTNHLADINKTKHKYNQEGWMDG